MFNVGDRVSYDDPGNGAARRIGTVAMITRGEYPVKVKTDDNTSAAIWNLSFTNDGCYILGGPMSLFKVEEDNMRSEEGFKIGDRVWELGSRRIGTVVEGNSIRYPVKVVFDFDGGFDTYTADGLSFETDKTPSLYHLGQAAVIESPPMPSFKVGQLVAYYSGSSCRKLGVLVKITNQYYDLDVEGTVYTLGEHRLLAPTSTEFNNYVDKLKGL